MLGNMMPLDEAPAPTKAIKKAQAKQHAKTVRKERKGERRNRGAPEAEGRSGRPARKGAAAARKPGVKKPSPKKH
jgi:23S rRNA pseudouridine955/2504/2580 synthase